MKHAANLHPKQKEPTTKQGSKKNRNKSTPQDRFWTFLKCPICNIGKVYVPFLCFFSGCVSIMLRKPKSSSFFCYDNFLYIFIKNNLGIFSLA